MPALGCTTSGRAITRTARSTAPSRPSGPVPQFSPQAIGCGPSPGSGASRCSIGSPATDSPWPTTMQERMNGTSGWRRMAAAHCCRAAREGCVSKITKSAPPSRRAATCCGDHLLDRIFRLPLRGQGADRSGHEHGPIGRVGHPPGDRRAGAVDVADLVGQAVFFQARPLGAEGVGRQHVGPGLAVVAMDGLDQLRIREAQFVERAVREDVVPVDLGAHRAVEDEHAAGQGVGESCRLCGMRIYLLITTIAMSAFRFGSS